MSDRLKAVRGGTSLAAGLIFSQCMTFGRNIVLIRMLTKEDWGIALAFAITLTFLDTLSDLSADKQLVQADEHEQYDLQGVTQFAYTCRGIWNCILIWIFSGFIAKTFFSMPNETWAFRYIALIPLMRGFMNQDYHRVQRRLQFWPAIFVEVIPNGTITLLAWPYAHFFKDYTAMLWLLMTDAALTLIVSHLVAESRYHYKFDRKLAARVFHFSWPLTINSGLMWFVLQGDRSIVGHNYTLAELGVYGAVVSLAMVPSNTVHRVSASVLLPMFSRCKTNMWRVRYYYSNYMAGMSLVAALMCGMFIAIGGSLTVFFYSGKYAGAGPIIAWLGVMWGLRLLRSAPSITALAYADSRNLMFANLVRVLGMAPMLYLGVHHMQLYWIAAAGAFSEILSVAAAIGTLAKYHNVPLRLSLLPCAALIVVMSGAAMFPIFRSTQPGLLECLLRGGIIVIASLGGYALIFPKFRHEVLETIAHYRRRNEPRILDASLPMAQSMESGLDGQLEIAELTTDSSVPNPLHHPAGDARLHQAGQHDVANV